jgi:Ca2+-binding RTX toxin-like protein
MLAASIDRHPFDIDGNGVVDPLSDGIVILRYLNGVTGNALIEGVVDPQGSRNEIASLMSHLREIESSFLDPDGDLQSLPTSDGVVILRRLAGFSSDALVAGSVNPEGIRRSPVFIEAYLDRPINDPPIGTVGVFSVDEDSVLEVVASEGLLSGVVDPDDDRISAILRTPPEHGLVELQSDGSFRYTPDANAFGTDTLTFVATDEFGGETLFSVQIIVNGINDPPSLLEAPLTLQNVYYSMPNDTLLDVSAEEGLFKFIEDLDGDDVTIRLANQVMAGTLSLNIDGSFQYRPNENFIGVDRFTVTLSDESGASVDVDIPIEVAPVNTKPTAAPLYYFVDEDTPLVVSAENGIFSGGTDPDGDTLILTDFERPDVATGDWEYRFDGSFVFTPAPNFNGETFFRYAVVDDDGNTSETAIGTIMVNPVFDQPVPVNDALDTAQNTRIRLDGNGSILSNDNFGDVALPKIVILSAPLHGTIALQSDNGGGSGLYYTPDADFLGNDSFTYAVGSGLDSYGAATVTLTVTPRGAVFLDTETGVLSVFGTESDDVIVIDTVFNASATDGLVTALILPNGFPQVLEQFPRTAVNAIKVFGFGGNDDFDNYLYKNDQVTEIDLPIEAHGGLGDDILRGGAFDDLLVGGPGFDVVIGRGGNDVIYGSAINRMPGDGENDLRGGAGNDVLYGGSGGNDMYGGSGDDTLIAGEYDSTFDNGLSNLYGDEDGNDSFTSETIIVPGNDRLVGSQFQDYLEGNGGVNTLEGLGGNDIYIFEGDLGSVFSEHNIIETEVTLDRSNFTFDNDANGILFGNTFTKNVYYDLADSENVIDGRLTIRVNRPLQFTTLYGGAGDDILTGHQSRPNSIFGLDGNDLIIGGALPDILYGGPGNDQLFGFAGDDLLRGEGGTNQIYGGPGVDDTDQPEVGALIHVQTFTNQPTRFGNKLVSVKINGTDGNDHVEIHPSGTSTFVIQLWTGGKSTSEEPDAEREVDFTDAYLVYKFEGDAGDDYYRDFTDLSAHGFGGEINGGDGNDTLIGGGGRDRILGGLGNDTIEGGGGNDELLGEEGDDLYIFRGYDLGRDVIDEPFDFVSPTDGEADTVDFSLYEGAIQITLAATDNLANLVTFRTNGLERGGLGIENVIGTRFSDTITGNSSANRIVGGEGNDVIKGLGGNDHLFGGPGVDRIEGGTGADTIEGGDGDDFLYGDTEASHAFDFGNVIYGGNGNDLIHGADGRDQLHGDAGEDKIFGHGERDTILGGADNDTIHGGSGNDLIFGEEGRDWLYGDEGNDEIQGGDHGDFIYGGPGNDRLMGEDGIENDYIERFGTPGDDNIYGEDGNDEIWGENGSDYLDGGSNHDTIYGGPGDDFLYGRGGRDRLFGQAGSDELFGGDGNDYLSGGLDTENEADNLDGGNQDDELWGGGGDDTLLGGHGHDTLYGQSGADTLRGGPQDDVLFGGDGDDLMYGDDGDDELQGGLGDDLLEGGNHDDLIIGMEGNDLLRGDSGDDRLYGDLHPSQRTGGPVTGGDDQLFGGSGTDQLYGQEGNDSLFAGLNGSSAGNTELMYGGEGANRFLEIIGSNRLLKTDRTYQDRNVFVFFQDGNLQWTESDIYIVDLAFQDAVSVRGDNRLLTFPWSGQELKFIKSQQASIDGDLGENAKSIPYSVDVRPSRTKIEVNQDAIRVAGEPLSNISPQDLRDAAEKKGLSPQLRKVLDTVWHELGHNWHPGILSHNRDAIKSDVFELIDYCASNLS